jgi:hypothetical protein
MEDHSGAMDAEETCMNFDKEFDASGLACPLPIVKTKKSLADMASRTGAARGGHRPGLGL